MTTKYPQKGTKTNVQESEKVLSEKVMQYFQNFYSIINFGKKIDASEVKSIVDSVIIAIKAIRVRTTIKNKANKERREEELENFDKLVEEAQNDPSITNIAKRNAL